MEITTAAGISVGDTPGPAENEQQEEQQLSGGSGQIEKGSGYGPPGEGSGETVPADEEGNSSGRLEEDRAASLPGTTAGETVADSDNAGAGINYGGVGDDAGP
jgi:hypothetical protein